eukprot:m.43156 g.43156  ORF g.43156 m.43156 type:complete len:895 (+) comp33420_c0_seq3:117-2801(+)
MIFFLGHILFRLLEKFRDLLSEASGESEEALHVDRLASSSPVSTGLEIAEAEERAGAAQEETNLWSESEDVSTPPPYQQCKEDEELPESDRFTEREWIEKLKSKWAAERKEITSALRCEVREALKSTYDPYGFCLHLIRATYRGSQGTQSLARAGLTELQGWVQHLAGGEVPVLTVQHKDSAVRLGALCSPTLFQLINSIYHLDREPAAVYQSCIWELIEGGMYKEAALCVSVLKLQTNYSVNDILLPLLFLNKPPIIERYLEGCREVQVTFLKLVDALCGEDVDIDEWCRCANVGVEKTEITKKQLLKMGNKFAKQHNLEDVKRPNSALAKAIAQMKSLLWMKYTKKSSGDWDELLESCVADYPSLQSQVVEAMVYNRDILAAVQFSRKFKLPVENLPVDVGRQLPVTSRFSKRGTDSNVHQKFYALPIPLDCVTFVDDLDKLKDCMKTILKPGAVIGFDSEWGPIAIAGTVKLALLQLATVDHVYLLDMVALPRIAPETTMTELIKKLFTSLEILVLGYSMLGDIEMLRITLPWTKSVLVNPKRVVDLMELDNLLKLETKQTEAEEEAGNEHPKTQKHRGLNRLVEVTLGLPLDKTEQMSNWVKRPLRQSQIVYAALDAHCLLDVYKVLCKKAEQLSSELKKDVNVEPELRKGRTKGGLPLKLPDCLDICNPPPREGPSIRPRDFQVVVDNMLQGLGKQLRSCGVDTLIVTEKEDHQRAVKAAKTEGRIILTSGVPFLTLRVQVPFGMCYHVEMATAREQVVSVLSHFKVKVTKDDIFSRCQVCNVDAFFQITSRDLAALLKACDPEKYSRLQFLDIEGGRSDVCLGNGVVVDDGQMRLDPSGVEVQISNLPVDMPKDIHEFFCCSSCGKIFWKGFHFSNLAEQFDYVLNMP